MSASSRDRSRSSRRSRRAAEPEPEDLEVLEELSEDDDLETLDELDELDDDDDDYDSYEEDEDSDDDSTDGIAVDFGAATEDTFDVRLTLSVGDMDRDSLLAGLDRPLRRTMRREASALRWQRVVVTFAGDAVIPSAAKDLVGEILAECRPLAVTVQRGYPDELVHEGEKPSASVAVATEGDEVTVDVDASELEAADLPVLVQPDLDKLRDDAAGKCFTFRFAGGATLPADALCSPLVAAGAKRITLATDGGDEVLYDREIAELVSVDRVGDETVVEIGAGKDEEVTVGAISSAFAKQSDDIAGSEVQVTFRSGTARPQEVACLLGFARKLRPTSLTLGDGDVLWPTLIKVATKDRRTALKIEPGARADIQKSFERELAAVKLAEQDVSFDWPAGMAIDAKIHDALLAAGPATLCYTFGGEDREPFHPVPITFESEGDLVVCSIDTEVAKPVELVRSMQRHLPTQDFSGKKVDVHILGEGLVSRTMRQTLVEALETGGAEQACLLDDGGREFLFPKLLSFEALSEDEFRITATPATRDAEQIADAAASEIEEKRMPEGSTARLQSSDLDVLLIEALVAGGASRVVLEGDGSLQVHPPLFHTVQRDGATVTIPAAPEGPDADLHGQLEHELPLILEEQGDLSEATVILAWHDGSEAQNALRAEVLDRLLAAGAAVLKLDDGGGKMKQLHPEIVRTYVDVLGRREAAEVPMIILGVDTDDLEGTNAALEKLGEEVEGRRVLLVFREGDKEVTGAADNDVVQATLAFLDSRARAVLGFRQATRQVPAHFEVLSSSVEGLEVGAKLRDPRAAM